MAKRRKRRSNRRKSRTRSRRRSKSMGWVPKILLASAGVAVGELVPSLAKPISPGMPISWGTVLGAWFVYKAPVGGAYGRWFGIGLTVGGAAPFVKGQLAAPVAQLSGMLPKPAAATQVG